MYMYAVVRTKIQCKQHICLNERERETGMGEKSEWGHISGYIAKSAAFQVIWLHDWIIDRKLLQLVWMPLGVTTHTHKQKQYTALCVCVALCDVCKWKEVWIVYVWVCVSWCERISSLAPLSLTDRVTETLLIQHWHVAISPTVPSQPPLFSSLLFFIPETQITVHCTVRFVG